MLELSDRFEYDETSPTCLRWKVEIRSGKNGNKIKELNLSGENYTELHGKERGNNDN